MVGFVLIPVAPPRLTPGMGIADRVAKFLVLRLVEQPRQRGQGPRRPLEPVPRSTVGRPSRGRAAQRDVLTATSSPGPAGDGAQVGEVVAGPVDDLTVAAREHA